MALQLHTKGNSLVRKTNAFREKADSFLDKQLMHTYQASVLAQVKGRSQVIKTEVRAINTQDASWLLWAKFGFHSIHAGPFLVKSKK